MGAAGIATRVWTVNVSSTRSLREVWFLHREYAVVEALQRHSYDRMCLHKYDSALSQIWKLRCVRYSMYITTVFTKLCVDNEKLSY